jgi:hypothetical protein
MTTPLDLINMALKCSGVLGVGQTAMAEDTTDALRICNQMLSQWQRKRWLIWHLADVAVTLGSASTYTVGLGGDFNVARPDRIEAAFLRQIVNATAYQPDWPIPVIDNREDYNRVALKSAPGLPFYVFYDPAYPLGILHTQPAAQTNFYELHISVKEQIGQFANLTTVIALPPEYEEAIQYNLAVRLRPMYQLPPEPTITALALTALNTLRNANTAIPRLQIPSVLLNQDGSWFNTGGFREANLELDVSVLG